MKVKPIVTVYAICKNEIQNVERWLSTLTDADNIIIVDTGSTDGTCEKIKELINENKYKTQARVFLRELSEEDIQPFDFSVARNIALDYAREINKKQNNVEEIVYVSLDLDEFIGSEGIKTIKEIWDTDYDVIEIAGITEGEALQLLTHKVHSDNPKWKWIRSVHEIISLGSEKKTKDWKVLPSNIFYIHEQDTNKERDYYGMLKLSYEKDPCDIKTVIYLAWEAINHNEMEEFKRYTEECLNLLQNNVTDEFFDDPEYIIQCYINLYQYEFYKYSENIEDTDHLDKALEYLNIIDTTILATGKFPKIRRVYALMANIYANKKEYDKAIEAYDKCLEITEAHKCWVEDFSFSDDAIVFNKGIMYYYKAEDSIEILSEALACFELVLSVNPENKDAEFNKQLCINRINELSGIDKTDFDRTQNKICVYAICKNEEQFVDKWAESMKEADYVVVLDTGSTDNTVEKLKAHGITVEQKIIDPWRFDTARNESLKLVPADANILVCTDLDEVLEPGWAQPLRERWIEGVHERGTYKYSWSHLPNGESGRVFFYDKIHSRKWIWRHPVHELLWNTETQTNAYNSENILNLWNEIHLHHYPDPTKSRSSYLPLLELRAAEDEDDFYGLIYLGHEYFYHGLYEKSIETLTKVLEIHKEQANSVEEASCYLFMGDAYSKMKNYEKAIDNYITAINIEPTYRESYLDLAKVYIEMNRYEDAINAVKEAITKSFRHYTWLERDISWTYEPYDLLCQAAFYNGNRKDSIVYAAKALSFEEGDERLRNNLKSCLELTPDDEIIN